MAPQPLEMAQLTVALYANVAARADVAERWEMMQRLLPPGIAVVKVDPSECASDAEAVEKLAAADAIVCLPYGGVVVDDALASQLPKLRHVQLLSAGFSEVTPQIAEMQQRGITVSNNGGSNAISVAEHAMMLILSVYRRMLYSWANARAGKWRAGLSTENVLELSGKTIGIVGFGNVGRQLARKASGFDVRIIYHDIDELMPGRDLELGATAVSLEELLAQSDVVSMHVPLDSVTQAMASVEFFKRMKSSAIFINTCRGGVQDEAELIAALETGEIAGAGLDVLQEEPPSSDNPLPAMENVVVTPHWAGASDESNLRAMQFALANLVRLRSGRPLLSLVDAEFAPHTLEGVKAGAVESTSARL